MTHPLRRQRKRTKGWRMEPGGVCCTRPGVLGNPFTRANCRAAGFTGTDAEIAARCVGAFRVWLGSHWRENWDGEESRLARQRILDRLPELRGRLLYCFCGLDQPCHVDVLAELANAAPEE